ncbi:zinc ribbon domain-containing protein [Brevibacterium litoralis]|uniref:zinc ribbon domain-containing protein n=1 Tax=Brevibacterium litoralis TaxID=3138935 RepID=UPI0032EABC18
MELDEAQQKALVAWLDDRAALRRNRTEAKQEDLLARLKATAEDHTARTKALQAATAEKETLEERIAALQADIDARGKRIAEMETALNAGTGLTSKDLVALQHDIESARAALSAQEDEELVAMDELETLDARIDTEKAELSEVAATGKALQQEKAATQQRLDAEAAEITQRLAADLAGLPEGFAADLRAREAAGGATAGLVKAGACGACGQEFSGVAKDALTHASPGTVLTCEECEAYLLVQ